MPNKTSIRQLIELQNETCANAAHARRWLADSGWAYRFPLPLVEQNNLANFQTGGAWEKFETNEFL